MTDRTKNAPIVGYLSGKPTRGVEPRTPALRKRCSGHLSYVGRLHNPTIFGFAVDVGEVGSSYRAKPQPDAGGECWTTFVFAGMASTKAMPPVNSSRRKGQCWTIPREPRTRRQSGTEPRVAARDALASLRATCAA